MARHSSKGKNGGAIGHMKIEHVKPQGLIEPGQGHDLINHFMHFILAHGLLGAGRIPGGRWAAVSLGGHHAKALRGFLQDGKGRLRPVEMDGLRHLVDVVLCGKIIHRHHGGMLSVDPTAPLEPQRAGDDGRAVLGHISIVADHRLGRVCLRALQEMGQSISVDQAVFQDIVSHPNGAEQMGVIHGVSS